MGKIVKRNNLEDSAPVACEMLAAYCKEFGRNNVANQFSVSRETIRRWIYNITTPPDEKKEEIQMKTKGKIKFSHWTTLQQ
jgi:DNA invertase Pin-like site-specific DNA recombinase